MIETKNAKTLRDYLLPSALIVSAVLIYFYTAYSRGQMAGVHTAPSEGRQTLPDFSLSDLGGKLWKLNDRKGKVVLLNFWATWCPPCRQETPGLVKLAAAYKDKGVEVVGVSMDQGGPAIVQKFVMDYEIPYPILLPTPQSTLPLDISSLPTTLLIDSKRKRCKNVFGSR